jgi:8-oxo-dGTP pyrophosphatase MutT (NUDIX family)
VNSERRAVLEELRCIVPADAVESQHHDQALEWVRSGAPLWRTAKPATPPMHLVSYFAVIDGDHVLLVDHRNARRWLPTGGHVEPGEHPRATVQRELREELGMELRHEVGPPLLITCTDTVGVTAGHTDVSLWYAVPGDRTAALVHDEEEFAGIGWFGFDEAPFERSDPHLRRFLDKVRSARG